MDHRIALKKNTPLRLFNDKGEAIHCVIEKEIGRGGSCIVYEASRETETGDKTFYRVKEFYPYKLSISRDENNHLIPAAKDAEEFIRQQKQLRLDFSRTNSLFYSGTNYASMTNQLDVFEQNGTTYVLSAYSSQKTLATYNPESIKECVSLVKQVSYVLGNMHEQGYLYLDTKPENVLIVDGLQKQIQLFDFNSLLAMKDLSNPFKIRTQDIRLSYSKGFAAIELQTSRLKRLGRHTDVYGVGALLFFLLFGYTPSAPDCEGDAVYNFKQIKYDHSKCDDKLFNGLTEFFHKALAVYYADRYKDMQEVMEQLNVIEKYADATVPRIYSTKIARPKFLFGREHEFEQLDTLLNSRENNCIFLTGMGGIGKSAFIREYLTNRIFDTVLYVHYKDSIDATISDDENIEINTISQDEAGKSSTRYFNRKLQKIRELVRGTNSILVIDNFAGKVDADFRSVLATDLKVVILTRQSPSYQSSKELNISSISDPIALKRLFEANLGRSITEDEVSGFEEILQRVDSHTLILELVAKQIAASHITLSTAAELATKHGFSSIAPEKVDYERDSNSNSDTIGNIIDALFEAGALSNEKRTLMKVVSLLGDNGININQFQQIMQLTSKDDINELIRDGWLMLSGDVISMHRVIQEAVHRWGWMSVYVESAEQFLSYFYVEIRLEATKNNYPKRLRWYIAAGDAGLPPELADKWIFKKLITRRDRKQEKVKQWQEKYFNKHGLIGMVQRERYARAKDESPADIKKLAVLLTQSEDILRQCKREPTIKANDAYINLLYETVLNAPRYKEDYILAEASNIFMNAETDFVMQGTSELLDDENSRNPLTIMKLYASVVLIYADNNRFEEAEKLLKQAEKLAEKVRHYRVYALYYNLLSDYYDILLNGAYDTEEPEEELLLNKMLDAIDKSLRYSKRGRTYDGDHIYANNILAKATVLMRSGRGTEKEISKLIDTAQTLVIENTSKYADVRLHYYLVCAWYFALMHNSASSTESFVNDARELADIIIPTDLEKIETIIIPCSNIYFELRSYGRAIKLLFEGIQLCVAHANTDAYARIKQELCDHLWQVGIEAEAFEICQNILFLIDCENNAIVDPKNKVVVSDETRSIIANGKT